MKVQRGQIWTVGLDPPVANEQAGVRPCVIVSVDRFNALPIRHALIVPLTTRERGFPHHVEVADDGGLMRRSWAMCEAVRAVSTQRFGSLISTADEAALGAITRRLVLWLGHRL